MCRECNEEFEFVPATDAFWYTWLMVLACTVFSMCAFFQMRDMKVKMGSMEHRVCALEALQEVSK